MNREAKIAANRIAGQSLPADHKKPRPLEST